MTGDTISTPDRPGGYVGDIWFGHPVERTLATHRWDGEHWHRMKDGERDPKERWCYMCRSTNMTQCHHQVRR
jgi:hypothetical protein